MIVRQKNSEQPLMIDNIMDIDDDQDQFTITNTSRQSTSALIPVIKPSMINRSCINTFYLAQANQIRIPFELSHKSQANKLSNIQKIDLSYNLISSIDELAFEELQNLKELLLNNNEIAQIPYHRINLCRALKYLNLNCNQINVIPNLNKLSFLEILQNPIKLITSNLIKLDSIEFISFDWLAYLIDQNSYEKEKDKFRSNAKQYQILKETILKKIDYNCEQNKNYCHFHTYFQIKIATLKGSEDLIYSKLILKQIVNCSIFFIQYLKSYKNCYNFANLRIQGKSVLQLSLQSRREDILELFKLRKMNFSQLVSEQTYFQALHLSCRYCNYYLFKYLTGIRGRKQFIVENNKVEQLVKEIFSTFNKDKDSAKILAELVKTYGDSMKKIFIKIPQNCLSKNYQPLSQAIFEIYKDQKLSEKFIFEENQSPFANNLLHFSMKCKNQQLLFELLNHHNKASEMVFAKNQYGLSCKYVQNATQVGRKMIWKKEKQVIKHSLQKQLKSIEQASREIPIEHAFRQLKTASSRIKLSNYASSSRISHKRSSVPRYANSRVRDEWAEYFKKISKCSRELLSLNSEEDYESYLKSVDEININIRKMPSSISIDCFDQFGQLNQNQQSLEEFFNRFQGKNSITQFQIFQSLSRLNNIEANQQKSATKTPQNSIENVNFWCCQNVVYD